MHRLIYFMFGLLLLPMGSFAQQQLIDSLKKQCYSPEISVEQRVKDLADLGIALRNTNISEALTIGQEAVLLSHLLKDKQYASYAWSRIYYSYRLADSTACVLTAIDSIMWYAQQSGSAVALGNAYRISGNYAYITDDNVKAVSDLQKASTLLENTEQVHELANVYYMLMGLFVRNSSVEDAEKYARLSLALSQKSPNPDVYCLANLSMTSVFEYKYGQSEELQNIDSAMLYARNTINYFEKYRGVIKEQFTGGNAALNYACYLWQFYPETPRDTVFTLLEKAIAWAGETNDQSVISNAYGLMSEYYVKDGKYDKAEEILLYALSILQNHNEFISPNLLSIIAGLQRLAEKQGDKDKIIKYQQLYLKHYKQTYDNKQTSLVKTLEATFENEKKEQTILYLKEQAAMNKKNFILSIILIFLSLTAAVLIWMLYRQRIKSIQRNAKILELKNQQLKLEHELIRQKNELLNEELFVGTVQLQQKNKLLETVKKEISKTETPSDKVNQIIKENLMTDSSFEDYKQQINNIHPKLFHHLQYKATSKLTDLDLKYCSYIYMKIPAKQIANLLHVEYNTVRTTKYRLKRKFNLTAENDLDTFIRNIEL